MDALSVTTMLLLALADPAPAADLVFDDYSGPIGNANTALLVDGALFGSNSDLWLDGGPAGAIGPRFMSLEGNLPINSSEASISEAEVLDFINGPYATDSTLTTSYDLTGLAGGGLDLSGLKLGLTVLSLDIQPDQLGLPLTFTIGTDDGVFDQTVNVTGAGYYLLDTAAFGTDLSLVREVGFSVNTGGNEGVDMQLDDFILVPEPATLGLVLSGGVALALRKRRTAAV